MHSRFIWFARDNKGLSLSIVSSAPNCHFTWELNEVILRSNCHMVMWSPALMLKVCTAARPVQGLFLLTFYIECYIEVKRTFKNNQNWDLSQDLATLLVSQKDQHPTHICECPCRQLALNVEYLQANHYQYVVWLPQSNYCNC